MSMRYSRRTGLLLLPAISFLCVQLVGCNQAKMKTGNAPGVGVVDSMNSENELQRIAAVPFPYAGLIVGTRQCRVLTVGNINSDATGFDVTIYN